MPLRKLVAHKYLAVKALLEFRHHLANWREVFEAYRSGILAPPLQLKNGPTIYHSEADDIVALFREVIVARCYAPADFYRPRPGDLVVDIGANIGVFALSLQSGRGGVRVHSFEPASDTRARLVRNIEANGLGELIKVHPEAVSNARSLLRLNRSADASHRSLFESKFVDTVDGEDVEAVSLSQALAATGEGPIELLKMDIEGAEIEAVSGADVATWNRVRRVIVEYHDLFRPGCRDHVVEVLQAQGFSRIEIHPERTTPGLGMIRGRRAGS